MMAVRRHDRRGALRLAAFACGAITLFVADGLRADQSGVPFWTSGQYASQAATPLSPGWTLQSSINSAYGTASIEKTFYDR